MVERASVVELVRGFQSLALRDEDGDPLRLKLHRGVSQDRLVAYETAIGTRVPASLRALLSASNGMCLFGLDVLPCEALEYHPSAGMVSFHAWGNGDFDCIALASSPFPEGTVLFASHSPDVVVPVASSLEEWLSLVVEEITDKGTLLHPDDYRLRPAEHGLYENVRHALDSACSGGPMVPPSPVRPHAPCSPTGAIRARIRQLLGDPDLQHLDDAIASAAGYSVRRERIDLLLPVIEDEVVTSGLRLDEIVDVIKRRSEPITELAVGFLVALAASHGRDKPQPVARELAAGVSITYAIYYFFLTNESPEALTTYLRLRRIPHANRTASLLKHVFGNPQHEG